MRKCTPQPFVVVTSPAATVWCSSPPLPATATPLATSNVTAAGRDEIVITVKRDPAHDNGFWIWGAADNLRVHALTAVDCAAALVANRVQGRVQ